MKVTAVTGGPVETNCYLLTEETGLTAAVDPGFSSPELSRALAGAGKVVLILLTHGHFDHTGGAEELRRKTGAPILLYRDEEPFLSDPEQNVSQWLTGVPMRPFRADRLLSDGERISFGAHTITVLHTPGHTAGGCCYLTEDLLFTGDTLMAGACGRTDFPTGDYGSLLDSLRRLSELPGDFRVLPGHGPETTLERERRENPYLMRNLPHDFDT